MGLDELSVSPSAVLLLCREIRNPDLQQGETSPLARKIKYLLERRNRIWRHLYPRVPDGYDVCAPIMKGPSPLSDTTLPKNRIPF